MFKKQRIQHLRAYWFGILGVLLVFSTVQAHAVRSADDRDLQLDGALQGDWQCSLPRGGGHGGGEVPTPFGINQHVELAVGEFYSLYGTVVASTDLPNSTSSNAVPMFAVDLSQHPWLANVQRVRAPYYQLTGGWAVWSRYLQKRVLLTAQARPVITIRPNGDRIIEIALTPVDTGSITPAAK